MERTSLGLAFAPVMLVAANIVIGSLHDDTATPLSLPAIASSPTSPRIAFETVPPACADRATDDQIAELPARERPVAEIWRDDHPCEPIPVCHTVRQLQLTHDLDAAPGRERVVANSRFGIVMFDANGAELARNTDLVDCNRYEGEPYSVTIGRVVPDDAWPQLIARTSGIGHCGEFRYWTLLHRDGARLVPVIELPAGGGWYCGMSTYQSETVRHVIVTRPGTIVSQHRWRDREVDHTTDDEPWTYHRDECRWRYDPASRVFASDDPVNCD
jgi:hypothetical protein